MRYAETLAKRGDQLDVFALPIGEQAAEEDLHGVSVHRSGTLLNEKAFFPTPGGSRNSSWRFSPRLASRPARELT